MRDRKWVDLEGDGKELGGEEGGKLFRIYYVRKEIDFQLKEETNICSRVTDNLIILFTRV